MIFEKSLAWIQKCQTMFGRQNRYCSARLRKKKKEKQKHTLNLTSLLSSFFFQENVTPDLYFLFIYSMISVNTFSVKFTQQLLLKFSCRSQDGNTSFHTIFRRYSHQETRSGRFIRLITFFRCTLLNSSSLLVYGNLQKNTCNKYAQIDVVIENKLKLFCY